MKKRIGDEITRRFQQRLNSIRSMLDEVMEFERKRVKLGCLNFSCMLEPERDKGDEVTELYLSAGYRGRFQASGIVFDVIETRQVNGVWWTTIRYRHDKSVHILKDQDIRAQGACGLKHK